MDLEGPYRNNLVLVMGTVDENHIIFNWDDKHDASWWVMTKKTWSRLVKLQVNVNLGLVKDKASYLDGQIRPHLIAAPLAQH